MNSNLSTRLLAVPVLLVTVVVGIVLWNNLFGILEDRAIDTAGSTETPDANALPPPRPPLEKREKMERFRGVRSVERFTFLTESQRERGRHNDFDAFFSTMVRRGPSGRDLHLKNHPEDPERFGEFRFANGNALEFRYAYGSEKVLSVSHAGTPVYARDVPFSIWIEFASRNGEIYLAPIRSRDGTGNLLSDYQELLLIRSGPDRGVEVLTVASHERMREWTRYFVSVVHVLELKDFPVIELSVRCLTGDFPQDPPRGSLAFAYHRILYDCREDRVVARLPESSMREDSQRWKALRIGR